MEFVYSSLPKPCVNMGLGLFVSSAFEIEGRNTGAVVAKIFLMHSLLPCGDGFCPQPITKDSSGIISEARIGKMKA